MAQPIKTFLTPFIQSKDHWKLKLLEQWQSCMGNLARRVTIEKIYDDTIILGVPDSCWLQELYMMAPTILQTINQSLDEPRIKEIRFKQVGRKTNGPVEPTGGRQQPSKHYTVVLSTAEKKALERISDHTLRSALEKFLIRCHRESKR